MQQQHDRRSSYNSIAAVQQDEEPHTKYINNPKSKAGSSNRYK